MKGMQRIKRHKNFINVVKYVLKPGSHHSEAPIVIGGNMTGDCVKELISEFDTASMLRTDIAKPAWHNSLRLPKNDELTNDQWIKIADDYMTQLAFSDTHLRCYVLHDDPVGQHIHIIANRIDSVSGKINLGRHESLVSGRIIQELEIKYGLTITKAADPKKPVSSVERKKLSRNETMYEKRTGEVCNKKELQNILDKSLTGKPDLQTFIKRLEAQQVYWKANIAITGRMNGLSFEYKGMAFKASQLGKKYSWSNLQRCIVYRPEQDNALLLNTRASIEAPAPAEMVSRATKESLTISEKIASLSSSIAVKPSVTASLTTALAPKMPKRQQMIDAVLDLQNAKKTRQVRAPRFTLWVPLLNLLKHYGFCLIHSFRKFKRVLKVHALTPAIQTQFTANLKRQK